jgi:hypothetical protein
MLNRAGQQSDGSEWTNKERVEPNHVGSFSCLVMRKLKRKPHSLQDECFRFVPLSGGLSSGCAPPINAAGNARS